MDDASLAHLRSCEALARSGFDKAVVYVQAAPSAWGVDSVISGFGAAAADWVQILSYADVPAGPGEPAAPCDRQVTILVAEVEECESQSDCYRVRATQELLGALFDRLCATMVVVILIEPDGSLLDATSLTPYLGGAFGGLYLTPLDGRAEQALALSELLDVPRGDGMGWLLAELRVLLFDAVYAGGRGG